ncbi:hypothetical protein T265_12548, partial [Opisthorchis viverrini]
MGGSFTRTSGETIHSLRFEFRAHTVILNRKNRNSITWTDEGWNQRNKVRLNGAQIIADCARIHVWSLD